jgi:hypothetical protein
MRSTVRRTRIAGTLAAMAAAATIAVPAASAMPIDPVRSVAWADITSDVRDVPPPPSLIAASAAEEYDALRSAGAQERDATVASQPDADEPSAPGGFDSVSAAIGAAAMAGLWLVSLAALGMRRVRGQRPASA